MLYEKENRLYFRYDAEELRIEPWGSNSLRVRAAKTNVFPTEDWALEKPSVSTANIFITENGASIENGKIKATVSKGGKVMIFNSKGELLLEEYARNRRDVLDPKCSAIEVEAREFKPIPGGDYHLTMRFESVSSKEKIFGMGQYQQDSLDLKGHDLELAHRNSQASVPFALSSLGYGFLWNNPSIGRAVLGKNIMSFEAYSTTFLDYWVVSGDSPSEIEEAYAQATGKVKIRLSIGSSIAYYMKGANDAGIRAWLLAVQTTISDPRRASQCSSRI
jgi:alpha-D-xyloside xylohydrolase